MQDDATPTDTKTSQKRETPEDAATAQEPERRVRPRETPVGAGRAAAAAAPEPEEKEEGASTRTPRPRRAIAESSDSDDDAESSDSDRHDARIPRHLRGRKLVQRYRLMEGEVRGDPSTNPCLDEESDEAPEMDLTPIIPGLPRHHSSDPRADDWVNVDDVSGLVVEPGDAAALAGASEGDNGRPARGQAVAIAWPHTAAEAGSRPEQAGSTGLYGGWGCGPSLNWTQVWVCRAQGGSGRAEEVLEVSQ